MWYGKYHSEDMMIYLDCLIKYFHDDISYTGKLAPVYWKRPKCSQFLSIVWKNNTTSLSQWLMNSYEYVHQHLYIAIYAVERLYYVYM